MAKSRRGHGATALGNSVYLPEEGKSATLGRSGRRLAWNGSPIAGKKMLMDQNRRQAAVKAAKNRGRVAAASVYEPDTFGRTPKKGGFVRDSVARELRATRRFTEAGGTDGAGARAMIAGYRSQRRQPAGRPNGGQFAPKG